MVHARKVPRCNVGLTLIVGLLAAILRCSTPANTAEIAVARRELIAQQDQPPAGCNIYLRGEIAAGDLERLRSAYKTVEPAGKYAPVFLCLSSQGGNFSEALKILQWLINFDTQIATVVNNREQCLSACAMIFMGGSELGHLTRYPRRWLHAGGQLGFHTPYVLPNELAPRTYTTLEVANAFEAATKSSRELAAQFARQRTQTDEGAFPGPWVRTSLFTEMLSRGAKEMLFIDTVDKVGRWEIDVFGVSTPKDITRDDAKRACRNAVAWIGDRFSDELHKSSVRGLYAMDGIKQDRTMDNITGGSAYEFWASGRQVFSCRVGYKYWAEYGHGDISVNFGDGRFGGANRAWVISPPTTKLISLVKK